MASASRILAAGCALAALLACSSAFAGSAASTRPGGGGGGHASGGHASGSASHGGGGGGHSAPAHASGHATYGYGGGSVVVGYPGYGYWYGGGYPWYAGYYPYWWWGGPYAAWGVWGWPGAYSVPVGSADVDYEIPATVTTEVSPGKATLRLDGEDVGRAKDYRGTWNQLYISPGTHVLELESEGYQTLRVTIDAQAGRSYTIAQQLQKGTGADPRSATLSPPTAEGAGAPSHTPPPSEPHGAGLRTGRLRLEVVPEDAAVYLDGEFLGSGREIAKLHGALPVAAGEHTIDLVRPGYQKKSFQVDVPSGESQPFRLELAAEGHN